MEKKTVEALDTLEGDLKGKYTSLGSMTKEEEKQLIEDHFLFKDDDKLVIPPYNPIEHSDHFCRDTLGVG